jgi:peptidoglycan/xylan/chitin deacetylase (PgdA/CDA1 family)
MRVLEHPRFASLLRSTGVLGALERAPRARGLLVLNYHRVGELADNAFDDATFSATAELFRAQVTYLKQRFAMPPVHDILESLERGRFDDPTVLVTFDDGYRDNHEIAFPVLRDLGAPACFFVVTGLLDAPVLPWWDHIAYSVKSTTVEVLRLEYPERLEFDLRATPRARATWRVLRAYKDAMHLDQPRFFDELATQTQVSVDGKRLGQTLFMSWDAAREMARAGMTIGSHTVTHPILAALPEAAQRGELLESREQIGRMVGARPDVLAYPVGGPGAFTDVTKRLAREVGYRAAFCYHGRLNRPATTDPFAIARLEVEHSDTWPQFRLRMTLSAIGIGS